MAYSKNQLFEAELQQSAELFKALSHPARLAILKYLTDTKGCITGDISEELPLGRTTVNQHLAALKSVGLIQGNISGAKTYYCIDSSKLKTLKDLAEKFLGGICCGESCCGGSTNKE
jgi:ArsR family transcriptional regulator, arsenate/arsenite/antimonite-responsive transcriptional repressor